MYILEIEPIIWKTWSPQIAENFPCFVCRKELATVFIKLQKGTAIIKLPVCESCSKKEIAELEEDLRKGAYHGKI